MYDSFFFIKLALLPCQDFNFRSTGIKETLLVLFALYKAVGLIYLHQIITALPVLKE